MGDSGTRPVRSEAREGAKVIRSLLSPSLGHDVTVSIYGGGENTILAVVREGMMDPLREVHHTAHSASSPARARQSLELNFNSKDYTLYCIVYSV